MIYFLYLEAILLIIQIIREKLYKSSIAILYLFIINTFVSPAVYYHLVGGDSYIQFSASDFDKYIKIGCVYLLFILVINVLMITKTSLNLSIKGFKVKFAYNSINVAKNISYFIIVICLMCVWIYRDRMPLLYQVVYHRTMAVLDRPDVSGSIPHYFTLSTIMSSFFPMFFFYLKERIRMKKTNIIAWFTLIIFVLLVGGNKGMLVYFAIFVWMRIWKMKIDWRIALAAVMLFYAYEVTIYGSVMIANGQFITGLFPPLRRFFVTQGAMFLNRIPIIESGELISGAEVSSFIYHKVYGITGGSAPTYFVGDLMVDYGYALGMFFSILVTIAIYYISIRIDKDNSNGQNLYKHWAQFYLIFVLGNSGFNSNFFIRMVIVGWFVFFLSAMDNKQNIQIERVNEGGKICHF